MISAGLLISVVPWLADVENQCSFEFIRAHPAALTIDAGRGC
jgi:hypothetical protein